MDFVWYVIIGLGVLVNIVAQLFGGNDKWGE